MQGPSTSTQTPFFADAASACDWIRNSLSQGVSDPQSSWHQGPITYLGRPNMPTTKIIVWREWNQDDGVLAFYTDTRTSKWKALTKSPTISALFYCPKHLVQLSLKGRAILSSGETGDLERFETLTDSQREVYQSREVPGALFQDQDPAPLKTIDRNIGNTNFGRVHVQILDFDFVSLHRQGHQRLKGVSFLKPENSHWVCP